VLVPSDADGLRRALAPVHRRYAGIIHARRKRTGSFLAGAVRMDEAHLAAALAYVSLKAVRARLVGRARDWRWSSTRAHLSGKDDGVTALAPVIIRRPGPLELASDAVNPSGRAGYGRSRSPALRQRDTK
jgi:putative transposase